MKSFYIIVHDVRGQALQFGYPIASQLAGGLCEQLERRSEGVIPAVIVRRYVESIASIVRAGIRDEANALAVELARTLAGWCPSTAPDRRGPRGPAQRVSAPARQRVRARSISFIFTI